MYYVHYIDGNGKHHSNLYHAFSAYYTDTFSPETEVKAFLKFQPFGNTYEERKESVRDIAIAFQAVNYPGLSWGELAVICEWFTRMGKKYGLLTEFRENAIC